MIIGNVDFTNLKGFDIISNSEITWEDFEEPFLELKLKAKDGCDVTLAPYVEIEYLSPRYGTITDTANSRIVDDYYLIQWTGSGGIESSQPTINTALCYGTAKGNVDIIDNYGLLRLYKTTKNVMSQIKSARFLSGSDGNKIDLGQFILSFVRYPFDISELEPSTIQLGYQATEIPCYMLTLENYEFDFGDVQIYGVNHDTSDIENCVLFLMLPFIGRHQIDSKYINGVFNVKYIVNVVSNIAICEIRCNSVLIDTIECVLGMEIPYIIKPTLADFKRYGNVSNALNNCVCGAYVEQYENTTDFYDTFVEKTLSDCSGFIKADMFDDLILPTVEENERLKNILTNDGVYCNFT